MIILRPATAADQDRIKAIIKEADINPMNLKWPNFLLAVDDATGEVVATGQIKTHGDGSQELASIATIPAYQKRGIATRIITALLAKDLHPLYLTCIGKMAPFYQPFGFRVLTAAEYPPYFKRLRVVARVVQAFAREDWQFTVMKRD
jgi:N-acetylglutamate synthase-like GNAT family acetyltransferase